MNPQNVRRYFQKNKQSIIILMQRNNRKRIFLKQSQHKGNIRYEFKPAWGSAPHPQKAWKGGQDAIFVSKNILVVADGVGGWAEMGVDAGIYARKLITNVKEMIETQKQLYYIERPEELAIRAVQNNEQKGSATLTILTLHPFSGTLRSYHVGDSIFGIFKMGSQPIIAEEQQRAFNVPFQVFGGAINILKQRQSLIQSQERPISDVFKGIYNQFSYSEISESIIMVASDGLWDNLFMHQIQSQLFGNPSNNLQKVKNMIRKTKNLSITPQYPSPFFMKAQNLGVQVPKCGKVDDISLILAEIVNFKIE